MTRPLKVGLQLPEVEYEARWSELSAMARLAEDIGLDSVWVGDHYLYREDGRTRGPWEAWTQLVPSAVAKVIEEIGGLERMRELGTTAPITRYANDDSDGSGSQP